MKSPLPKIARDLAALVGIARKETDPEKIEAALTDARSQVQTAVAEREAAEATYRDGLLDATPAESERQLAAASAAKVKVDRAEALVAALSQRLTLAREEQDRARRKAIHDDAVAKCAAIRARLPVEYRQHALAIRALLRDLAEAEVARRRAEVEALEFGYIPSPEDVVRGGINQPEEIVSRETVDLWVIDASGAPVPADRQAEVRPISHTPGLGQIHTRSSMYVAASPPMTCTKRPFIRTRLREAVLPGAIDSLLGHVALPALHRFGDDFVTRDLVRGIDTALGHLSRDLPPDPTLERPVIERLEPALQPDSNVTPLRGAA